MRKIKIIVLSWTLLFSCATNAYDIIESARSYLNDKDYQKFITTYHSNGLKGVSKLIVGKVTPLVSVFVSEGDYLGTSILLEKGADANEKLVGVPLSILVNLFHCNLDVFNLLIDNGAEINITMNLSTPLTTAALTGDYGCFISAVNAGGDIMFYKQGSDALFAAIAGGNFDVFKFLIKNNVPIDRKYMKHESLLELIEFHLKTHERKDEFVNLIKSRGQVR